MPQKEKAPQKVALLTLVVDEGFEPSKAKPADLQSAPIGRSGNLPLSGVRLSGLRNW